MRSYRELMRAGEAGLIKRRLADCGWNVSETARSFDMHLNTLKYRIKVLRIIDARVRKFGSPKERLHDQRQPCKE